MADASSGPGGASRSERDERVAAERRGAPYLLYRDGEGRQRIVALSGYGDALAIGRHPASEISLSWDPRVSRAHARLERAGDGWAIADDPASRNGTFVNGERVQGRRPLANGDSLRLGDTTLTFRAPPAAPAVTASRTPARASPGADRAAAGSRDLDEPGPPAADSGRSAEEARSRRGTVVRRVLAGLAVGIAILLAAQLFLPGVAERRVRSALGPQASGVDVSIRAVPAIKLLWRRADSVTVSVDRLAPQASGGGSLGDMLARLRVARQMDIRVGELRSGALVVRGATVRKDGDAVVARADVDTRRLERSLPGELRVRPLAAPARSISLEGRAAVLGRRVAGRATLLADRGRIVVQPDGVPLASLVRVPLFDDERIAVDDMSARPSAEGILFVIRAHLRNG